jgi:hypothetical protein
LSGQTIRNSKFCLVKPLAMAGFIWSNHWEWKAISNQTIGNGKLCLAKPLEMASFV